MLLKSLGLSVWITDAEGVPLPEYQDKQAKDGVTECWTPSTEGANFKIKWGVINQTLIPAGCVARATPYFDGVRFGSGIGRGKGELSGHRVGHTTIRLYQFGKRIFTDEESTALYDTAPIEDLGTIRVDIDWGHFHRTDALGYFSDPTRGPIHEKLAKKGFGDLAALGQAVDALPPSLGDFIKKEGALSGSFIFRYASEGWLQARGIIPCVLKSKLSTKLDPCVKLEPSNSGLGQKRTRTLAHEIIDVDAIEDDDDVVIISTKKQKLERNVKPQI